MVVKSPNLYFGETESMRCIDTQCYRMNKTREVVESQF